MFDQKSGWIKDPTVACIFVAYANYEYVRVDTSSTDFIDQYLELDSKHYRDASSSVINLFVEAHLCCLLDYSAGDRTSFEQY